MQVDSIEDATAQQLVSTIAAGCRVTAAVATDLEMRKLVSFEAWKTYQISEGAKLVLERRQPHIDPTAELMQKCAPLPTHHALTVQCA